MKISEAIIWLTQVQKDHGDLEIVDDGDNPVRFSVNDDTGEKAVLVE